MIMMSRAILPSDPVTSANRFTASAKPSRATCQVVAGTPSFNSSAIAACTSKPLSPSEASVPAAPANPSTAPRGGGAARRGGGGGGVGGGLVGGMEVREADRGLVAEGHGQRLLQVGAPGHRRVAVLAREVREDAAQVADLRIDDIERVAHLQRHGRVHDVLRGRAPVHVAARVAAHRHQLVHERQDGVADDVGLMAHVIEIDAPDARFARDGLGRVGGDHTCLGLGPRQRDFGVDVALDQRVVGEQRAHLRRAEGVTEKDRIDDGAGHRDGGGRHAWIFICSDIFTLICPNIWAMRVYPWVTITAKMNKPRFTDIARHLKEGIASGHFPLGSLLPTELALRDHYQTSRHTVRMALQALQDAGLVSRRKNVGTRVESAVARAGFQQSLASVEDLMQYGAAHLRLAPEIDTISHTPP